MRKGQYKDLAGQRFGRLVAIEPLGMRKRYMWWRCVCDCGEEHEARGSHLTGGNINSCGCYARDESARRLKETPIAKKKTGVPLLSSGHASINVNKKQVPLHRYVMEQHLGRKLRSDEIVHHIDDNKLNNDISNLQVTTRAEHALIHSSNLPKQKKLTKHKAKRIYEYAKAGIRGKELAELFKVSPSTISEIIHGRAWASATGAGV